MTNLKHARVRICITGMLITALNLMLLAFCETAQAIPVFPGAKGFGTNTRAAYALAPGTNPTVYKVTNLNASGSGSLQEAMNALGPRVVVFEVSGTIVVNDSMSIKNPYIIIAGQTAPSPGITIRGAVFRIRTHDVLIQHLRFRVGDNPGYDPENRDGIQIESYGSDVYNVVVDHCSVSWAIDESLSVWQSGYDCRDITISDSIFSEALYKSIHPNTIEDDKHHSMGPLTGRTTDNVSFIGNLMAHNADRNPYIRGRSAIIVNDVNYHSSFPTASFYNNTIEGSWVGNVIKNSYALQITNSTHEAGSKIYVHDNEVNGQVPENPWDAVYYTGDINAIKVLTPPVWPTGFIAKSSSDVESYVLANAGARPADRDSVDTRIVNDVRNNTGAYINSQDDVGGWPELGQNTRPLTLPNNPHGDDDNDGYTNLEEWLHEFAASVESSLSAPKSLRIKH